MTALQWLQMTSTAVINTVFSFFLTLQILLQNLKKGAVSEQLKYCQILFWALLFPVERTCMDRLPQTWSCKVQSVVLSLSYQHQCQEETQWYWATSFPQHSFKESACANPSFVLQPQHVTRHLHRRAQYMVRPQHNIHHNGQTVYHFFQGSQIQCVTGMVRPEKDVQKPPCETTCTPRCFLSPKSWNKVRRSVKMGLVARTVKHVALKGLRATQSVCVCVFKVCVC